MKQELKSKWVEALRSGKYKQSRSALRNIDGGFCCLGVLCDIEGLRWIDVGARGKASHITEKYADQSWLSKPHLQDIGLREEDMSELMCMNDSGVPFTEIADYIEREL